MFVVGKLVSQEHFGGFLESSNYEQVGGDKKSWKERMEELITKSKKEKVRKEKEMYTWHGIIVIVLVSNGTYLKISKFIRFLDFYDLKANTSNPVIPKFL